MEWLSKGKSAGNWIKGSDVFISEIEKGTCISFRIHKNVLDKITRTSFVRFAIEDDRIYFDESDQRDGWRLSPSGKNGFFFKVRIERTSLQKVPVGNYELKFDKYNGYFYIDLNESLNTPKFERRF